MVGITSVYVKDLESLGCMCHDHGGAWNPGSGLEISTMVGGSQEGLFKGIRTGMLRGGRQWGRAMSDSGERWV